jgi:hypothetical protein
MSVYGYRFQGVGYRCPRRARIAYISDPKKWTRAALFNATIAKTNPWVNFLRENGYYKHISELLQDARDYYFINPQNLRDPLKKISLLERKLAKLEEKKCVI